MATEQEFATLSDKSFDIRHSSVEGLSELFARMSDGLTDGFVRKSDAASDVKDLNEGFTRRSDGLPQGPQTWHLPVGPTHEILDSRAAAVRDMCSVPISEETGRIARSPTEPSPPVRGASPLDMHPARHPHSHAVDRGSTRGQEALGKSSLPGANAEYFKGTSLMASSSTGFLSRFTASLPHRRREVPPASAPAPYVASPLVSARSHPADVLDDTEDTDKAKDKKKRVRWTQEMHDVFMRVVEEMQATERITPKGILRRMGTTWGLNTSHIKSHLQKYRAGKYANGLMQDEDKENPPRSMSPTASTSECPTTDGKASQSDPARLMAERKASGLWNSFPFSTRISTSVSSGALAGAADPESSECLANSSMVSAACHKIMTTDVPITWAGSCLSENIPKVSPFAGQMVQDTESAEKLRREMTRVVANQEGAGGLTNLASMQSGVTRAQKHEAMATPMRPATGPFLPQDLLPGEEGTSSGLPIPQLDSDFAFLLNTPQQITDALLRDALKLQMKMQKQLAEQLDLQRHLQETLCSHSAYVTKLMKMANGSKQAPHLPEE